MSRTTDWILELEDRGTIKHNGYEYVFVGTNKSSDFKTPKAYKKDKDKNLSLNGTDKNKYDIINTKKT